MKRDDIRQYLSDAREQFRDIALASDTRAGNGDTYTHRAAGAGVDMMDEAIQELEEDESFTTSESLETIADRMWWICFWLFAIVWMTPWTGSK